MKNDVEQNYFLGLDIGTDSVGYAVTDTTKEYNLLKYKGEPMWGVTLFEEAGHADERRAHRTARRALDRRQQRVKLIQELFAKEISKVDENFYRRIDESALLRVDAKEPYCIFNDSGFSDKDYHKRYPTIHHLIVDLINNKAKHDVRLVYLACAWLVAHRGHFLSDVSEDNVGSLLDFNTVFEGLEGFIQSPNEADETLIPWSVENRSKLNSLANILVQQTGVNRKYNDIITCLFDGKKPSNKADRDKYTYSTEGIFKLLAGGKYKLSELFFKEEYTDLGSISLDIDDEALDLVLREIGDDASLLIALKAVYDWTLLSELLINHRYISESKVDQYDQHKKDLLELKRIIKSLFPEKYDSVFKSADNGNYVSYCGNVKGVKRGTDTSKFKRCNQEAFCDYLKSALLTGVSDDVKEKIPEEMRDRILAKSFMPKQVNGDNRVIPYQLYYIELKTLLEKASQYLSFLNDKDTDGITTKEKILSVMKFRVPYYVGPLNKNNNERAWIERKSNDKIYPWNFEKVVDLDKSEQAFIDRMTNTCSYIAGEKCLPKHSLIYEKMETLNEINNIKVNGVPLSVDAKQCLFNDLFAKKKKVTIKAIKEMLCERNYCSKEDAEKISGIDATNIKASLQSRIAFSRLLSDRKLDEKSVEKIIERLTYSDDKLRFKKWITREFPQLNDDDIRYITSLKIKDFGRLSARLLCETYCANKTTGEIDSVIGFLWNSNDNLSMILLSDKYEFKAQIEEINREYYSSHPASLSDRLDQMYVSNALKRPIIRTLEIVNDIVKATGHAPEKVFVEMARGATEKQRNNRTKPRRQQLIDLYNKIADEDVRELSKQLDQKTDNDLQSDKLFLYFMQLGKSMYSGKVIDIDRLGDSKLYDVDHIYPQSFVKDDSILNNKVLVLSEENGKKGNMYPVDSEIRRVMSSFWFSLREHNLITEEKYKRLVRSTPFTEDEEWNFVNRQIVETQQSTKVIAELLNEKYPQTRIVYVKARLASNFRSDYEMLKSRVVNDLHHAKDAYLNIVCGNVYTEKYTKEWFLKTRGSKEYTVNQKILFSRKVVTNGQTVWDPDVSFASVRHTMQNNNVHETVYSFCRHGSFFDQQPVSGKEGLVPRKANLVPTDKYGGYNKTSNSYFMLVKYFVRGKHEIMVMPVEYMYSSQIEDGNLSMETYAIDRIERITGKKIEKVEFPLGHRKLKINTILSFDGFLGAISGSANGGQIIIISPIIALRVDSQWELYIKKLESFVEKIKNNEKLVYDEKFDFISKQKNEELYEALIRKYTEGIYSKRPNPQGDTLEKGIEVFRHLSEKDQAQLLLNIIQTFGRTSSGSDFQLIGGSKRSAVSTVSSFASNWMRKYKSVKIIDYSVSGIWKKESVNILQLL